MAGLKYPRLLLASTALSIVPLLFASHGALAGPENGTVSHGAATISQSGTATSIHQSTDRAIISWDRFDVGATESVRFYQPGSGSLTLNRIHDSKASQIDGLIEANGRIMLLNQNGIVFGAGSRVDVAGLIAGTGQVDDAAFMSGADQLMITPGSNASASIINYGHITAKDAGLVGLVAPNVENHGIITAHLGKVTLAGAEHVTLDLAGDSLISIDVSDQVDGKVLNTGTITADGGTIALTASRARDAVEKSIVNTGTLQANTVGIHNGRILLSAGGRKAQQPALQVTVDPAVENAGRIIAKGLEPMSSGGHIEIIADSIRLTAQSLIDTSGIGDGGTINIGGSYQGASDRATAAWVEVAHGSATKSNGGAEGDGGTIIFWADRLMSFRGLIEAEAGDDSGDGGFVEVSGKHRLIFDGQVSTRAQNGKNGILLLDPTNIEILAGPSQNVTGSSPYTPDADDVVSVIDAATLLAALSGSSVIVQTRATGSQAGDITVNAALTWGSGNTLTLDAHHDIIVNQALSGSNIRLTAGNDVQLNADLSGTGNLVIEQKGTGTTMGIGAGSGGTLNLSATDLSHIIDGWSQLTFGRVDSTAGTTVTARTWTDSVELLSGTGVITISGAQNFGTNNLSIITNADLALGAALTGTGSLSISQGNTATSMGLGTGQAGTVQLTNAEIANITDGWAQLSFGRSDSNAALNVGALTWNDNLNLRSGAGGLNINGAQTMGSNTLHVHADGGVAINAALTGTGSLIFEGASAGTSIGLGNGAAGTLNLDTTELSRITNGWTLLTFGNGTMSGAMNVTAATWQDAVLLSSGAGVISVTGAQAIGANNLSILTDADLNIGAALTGTGILTVGQNSAPTTIGLGTGQIGTVQLSDAELALITDGWSSLVFGNGGVLNVGALTWNDNVTLSSNAGTLNINGTQSMGANTLTLRSNSDIAINAGLTGSGILNIISLSGSVIGVGTGQAGAVQLSNAEIANITNGWSNIIIGDANVSGINVGALTWNDALTLQSGSGIINISGTQTMGANALTISTDSDLTMTGALTGSGTLTIAGLNASTTMGIGTGQAGALQMTNAEVGLITNGWSSLVLGRTDGSGAVNIGALTWNDALTLQSGSGIITVVGAQAMGANALTILTNSNLALNAALGGTTTLTISSSAVNGTMGLGNAATGTLNLDATEVGRITNGWANLIFGRTDGTGAINLTANTWNDAVTLNSASGVISISGAQGMGANALTINTDADIAMTGALTGSGTLTIRGQSVGTTIGLGNAATGTINLTATEVGLITNGWGSLIFGRTDGTGAINLTANTWNDNLTLNTSSGVITVGGAQAAGGNNITILTDADLVLNAALTGTGSLVIAGQALGTTIGLGNGSAGTLNLNATEVGRITNGWGNLYFGRTNGTGDINVTANTWNDTLNLRTATGVISITGTQTMNAANNIVITTDADLNIAAALTSAGGTLTIVGQTATTSMGLGNGQIGTLQLSDAELAFITNGWGSLVFGNTAASANMNIGALTWNDALTLRTGTGVININGAQALTGNNLTITADSNLNIAGALTSAGGTLTISQQTAATTFGIGDGETGTIHLSNTDLGNITDGWASILLGATTATGAMNVGAWTWNDVTTLRSAAGVISINGQQNTGANNFAITSDSNLVLGANLVGTGTLTLSSTANTTTIGIGTGQTGTFNLTDTELGYISSSWATLVIGNATGTGVVNVGAYTWNDNLLLRSAAGVININGNQNMGSNNLSIATDGNLNLANDLIGTGTLNIRSAGAGILAVGTGQTGGIALTDAELDNINDGWAQVNFGSTAQTTAINIGTRIWTDNVGFLSNSGIITVGGDINTGSNTLTFSTNANLAITGSISGTSTLTFQGAAVATTIGIGTGQGGGINLDNLELGGIMSGWSEIVFGSNTQTGVLTIGSYTWQYNTRFVTNTGVITVAGAQTVTDKNMTFETNANMAISAALGGTGTLTIRGESAATSMGIGTSQAGTLAFTNAELAFIQNGWSQLVFGRSDMTSQMNIAALTWNDNVKFSTGSGQLRVNGAQTMGANNLTLETNSDLLLSGNLTGTGTLTIQGASAGTGIGVGNAQAGALALASTDLSRLVDGWSQVQIGRNDMTADINIGANNWLNRMTFLTRGNIVINGNQTTTETTGTTMVFASLAGAFINNGSSTSINPNTGRFLVYSVNAANDTYNGMSRPTILTQKSYYGYAPGSVLETGNVFIYSDGAPKVIYARIDNATKVYGDVVPTLTWTYLGGLEGTDALSAAVTGASLSATGALTTDNVGVTRTITGMFTTGLGYTVSFTNGTLSVTKAPIVVQSVAASRVYGDANPALTVSYTGFRNGETSAVIDTLATASTTATITSNVGTYAITGSGAIDNNYIFNYNTANLTVTKANLTITADNKTREYGDANPALTVSYSGFKNADTAAVIDTNPTLATTAIATTGVGSVAITLTGGTDNNYNLVLVNGSLSITKAMLTATADNQTREYGDANPVLTVSYTGFKNGENSGVIDTLATASTAAINTSNVGSYVIGASGATDGNYDFTYVDGSLAVTKAMLTVTADNKAREYGDANPALTAVYTGFKNGETSAVVDSLATISTAAINTSNVGSYVIGASGASDGNYNFTYVDGSLAVTKAMLTATADNKTREYGDANPALTISYTGFKNGENSGVIDTLANASTAAINTSNVGSYVIGASGATDGNYDFTYVDGSLAVTKAMLTATADNKTREYGDANPALTVSYTGFKNGENSGVIDTLANASTAATNTSNVGSYAIGASGATDGNYSFTYSAGTLAITKANLLVTIDNKTRQYGLANPAFTAAYTGFKNGETSSVLDTAPTFSSSAVIGSGIGTYAITAAPVTDNNYSVAFVSGNLTITRAPLTIDVDDQIRLYGDPNPPLTYSISGFRNGDTASVISGLSVTTAATPTTPLGFYAINASGATTANYTVTYNQGLLEITGTMPPPPPEPPPVAQQPDVPPSFSHVLSSPELMVLDIDPLFYTRDSSQFYSSALGRNISIDSDGYVVIYYHRDPFSLSFDSPFVRIDPLLFMSEQSDWLISEAAAYR